MQAVAGDVTFAVAVPVVSGLPIHPAARGASVVSGTCP